MKRRRSYASVAVSLLIAAAFAAAIVNAQSPSSASAPSTPRLANGKPDLSGMWADTAVLDVYRLPLIKDSPYTSASRVAVDETNFAGTRDGVVGVVMPTRRPAPNQTGGQREATNEFTDFEFTTRLDPNKPLYKPQFWDKVQDVDYNTNFADPIIVEACHPAGVPRMGPPRKIVQTVDEVIFIYGDETRIIPTDGRSHDPSAYPTYRGDAVAHWEGDTLVVDVRNFNDRTWIAGGIRGGGNGYFHSYEMRVIERLRRDGNTLHYQATVEDPEVLMQPWTMNAVVMRLNPKGTIVEPNPCDNSYDRGTIVGRTRH